jgi:hypothetical protein
MALPSCPAQTPEPSSVSCRLLPAYCCFCLARHPTADVMHYDTGFEACGGWLLALWVRLLGLRLGTWAVGYLAGLRGCGHRELRGAK